MNTEIPKDFPAGWQALADDVLPMRGDVRVCDDGTMHTAMVDYNCTTVGDLKAKYGVRAVYRKIPVAKQGDLDHVDSKPQVVPKSSNIAQQAIDLVCGDRNASYGNPADDYAGTAKVWSGLLHRKLKEDITAREAILMMAAMKINREVFKPKEDSRVDAIGYMLCADWATTGMQPNK